MDFTDEQLLRIAKVIKNEPVFQLVFDKNLEGKCSDDQVMGHVVYYESHGHLYGYTKPSPTPIKTTMQKADEALRAYKYLQKKYGGRVRTAGGKDIADEIEEIYGVPMVRAKKKRTKKVQPVVTRKSKKKEPVPFRPPTMGDILEPRQASQEQFNKWLKEKRMFLYEQTRESSADGLIRTRNTYKFPDGSTVEEVELNGNVISQHVNRSIGYNYGYPFYTGGFR